MLNPFVKKQPVRKVKRRNPANYNSQSSRKVLIISHNHPEFFPGGGEKFAYQMFNELNKKDWYRSLFLAATGKISRDQHSGTPFLAMGERQNEFLFWGDGFDYFMQSNRDPNALLNEFAAFLRDQKPDVVHFHHALRFGMEAIQVVKSTLPNEAIVYTLHDFIPICQRDGQMITKPNNTLCDHATPARCHSCFPDIQASRFKLREVFIKTHFDLVDAFVSPSQFLINRFVRWGLPEHKIHLIRNGTEAAEVLPRNSRSGKHEKFAFFGQISPYKGTELILDAAEILLKSGVGNFSISIHGNISLQTEEFQQNFREKVSALSSNIRFHGVYSPQDLPSMMAEVDWVIVPSVWWENSPLVIAEAFRHKKPVICSNIGGMAEMVEEGTTGLHFNVGDSQSLADTINYGINKSGLWEQLVSNIKAPPTMQECVDQYIKLYTTCMEDKNILTLVDEDLNEPKLKLNA